MNFLIINLILLIGIAVLIILVYLAHSLKNYFEPPAKGYPVYTDKYGMEAHQ